MAERLHFTEPEFYGIGEISRELSISPSTITLYRKQGLVRPIAVLGRRHFYNRSGVDQIKHIYEHNIAKHCGK